MNYTIFNTQTGQIYQSGSCVDDDYHIQYVPDGFTKLPIESNINQYYKDGLLVNIPISPGIAYVFNFVSKQWEIDVAIQTTLVLSERNRLLKDSDWTQLVDVPLDNKSAWSIYRQSLRDITSQSGYPVNVIWPTKPE
jgi:Phage tail assembly chaperone protein